MQQNESKLDVIFERYLLERPNSTVTKELFKELVILFPAVLVLLADGYVDTVEMQFLHKAAFQATHKLKDVSESTLKAELRFVIWGARLWREPFLAVLKDLIEQKQVKQDIVELMLQASGASAGSVARNVILGTVHPNTGYSSYLTHENENIFMSNDEKEEIVKIADYLGLMNDPIAKQKLQNLIKE